MQTPYQHPHRFARIDLAAAEKMHQMFGCENYMDEYREYNQAVDRLNEILTVYPDVGALRPEECAHVNNMDILYRHLLIKETLTKVAKVRYLHACESNDHTRIKPLRVVVPRPDKEAASKLQGQCLSLSKLFLDEYTSRIDERTRAGETYLMERI